MLIEELLRERERLATLLVSAERDIENAPEGSLRISHTTTKPEFYHRKVSEKKLGIYIHKDQIQTAKALAQKNYAEIIEKSIYTKQKLIESVIDEYKSDPLKASYNNLNPVRQQLVKPYILEDADFASRWLSIPYEPNPKYPEDKGQTTSKGEKVRSKSEVIIADNLKMMGIPYKYEAPLKLKDGSIVYPDFTCLNVKRRKIVYWEHFGKMGNQEYRNNDFFWKLKNYGPSGIIQGMNLIMTFEDEENSFDFLTYKSTIEDYLLR
ncbi:hypothetical protein [Butyrivibrio sp. FCS014]|uniref:hypothetical protein n=1 Tax=Butyrivibrio sp. FCS014 TaxID=1408304 RepID=UPI000467E5AF|nr:hypothetical protein [Butyrivibrio sp. FCS014]